MSKKEQGIIIKIDSNKSWIFANGQTYQADIKKSVLRNQNPLVGDRVVFEVIEPQTNMALIQDFNSRINFLPKPKIANVDQILIITALKEPNFNSYLLNKYLIFLNALAIKPILIFTKSDLIDSKLDQELLQKIKTYKQLGYQSLVISNKKPKTADLDELQKLLTNKISVLVGQTGAGKSTMLNRLLKDNLKIKTQEISKALNRGKHTTTTTQLYPLNKSILIADTPGFGNFTLNNFEIRDLIYDLPLLKPYLRGCKYPDCTHSVELDCSLKIHNQLPLEAQFIYEDYCHLIQELKNQRGKMIWKTSK